MNLGLRRIGQDDLIVSGSGAVDQGPGKTGSGSDVAAIHKVASLSLWIPSVIGTINAQCYNAMTPIDLIASQLDWANKNICNNIDFIPEDKFTWKPAPTAKSPLEIVKHMTSTLNMMTSGVTGEPKKELPAVATREESKQLINQMIQDHVTKIRGLSDAQMQETAHLEIGDFPMSMAVGMPVIECINHHGQFTYIETLMGDDESHLLLK